MSILSTAAFDPVFWLHHCNVDRLFAMWQAVYPNSYGGSQVAPASTWTIAKGTTQNANSPLTPFHRDASGNFWTTTLVRNWKTFKYTYPEFANSDGSTAAIKNYINNLYGPNASATAGSSKRNALPAPAPAASSATTSAAAAATDDPTPLVAQNGSLYQYVANVQTPRYALESSYTIYLFHNDPATEDPAEWVLDSNLIGPIGVLASSNMNSDLLIVNSVPLTRTLSDQVAAGALPSLAEALVVPYLEQSLKWRIVGSSGSIIDPDSLDGFLVSVYASTASQPASDSELPTWSAFIPLAQITENKAGGADPSTIINGTASALTR
jgi:tyrosinase